MKKERVNEIYGVLLLLAGLFIAVGLLFHDPADHSFYTTHPQTPVHNPTGIIGAYLSHYLFLTFGLSAYSVPFLLIFWSSCFFLQKVPSKNLVEVIGIAIAIFSFASILSLLTRSEWKIEAGGLLGYLFSTQLEHYFGLAGGLIIAVSCLLLATLLFTDFLLYPIFQKVWDWVSEWFKVKMMNGNVFKIEKPKKVKVATLSKTVAEIPKIKFPGATPIRVKEYKPVALSNEKEVKISEERSEKKQVKEIKEIKERMEERKPKDDTWQPSGALKEQDNFVLPTIDLLSLPPKEVARPQENFAENSRILEETFRDFGLEVKVVEVEQGPVLTRYEILPAAGVKVTKILSFSDDLALALKAPSIRFIAPIPGKSAIGIEVPNSITTKVFLREIIESREFKQTKCRLPLTLGKDSSGQVMISDLAEMPHLLIAGTTGSGKTVCVNSVIAGLVYAKLPNELKFVMVDPKMVELAIYNKLPHMLTPVVTDLRKAAATLNWVVSEMDKRYRIFAQAGTRNIQAFNARPAPKEPEMIANGESSEEVPKLLPYIVVVIDELADLMLVMQDKVETAITRLAQLSRAVGIHLILATQRPSVDVITGVIKANFPARISFKVASKTDSRTVLDVNGADKLIGKGDLLFLEPGREKPVRGQACFVSDEEVNRIVGALSAQGTPQFRSDIQSVQEGKTNRAIQEKDEIYDEAVRVVMETKQASVSVLQRRLKLGYGRAARIMDMMEAEGIVGPYQGTKPRELLMDRLEKVADISPTETV